MQSLFLRTIVLSALLSACVGPTGPQQPEDQFRRNVAVSVGRRYYDTGSSLDRPPTAGLTFDLYRPCDLVGFEVGVAHTRDSEDLDPSGNIDAHSTELRLGLRKTFELQRLPVQPYVGAGIVGMFTEVDFRSPGFPHDEDSDWDTGVYVHVGARVFLTERVFLGLDLGLTKEEFLDYGGFDLDSQEVNLQLGFRF